MLKFYYKTASRLDQIRVRNKERCNGIEVQMLDMEENLKDIKWSKHKIHTIHLPFTNKECNLDQVILNDDVIEHLDYILGIAQKNKAGIVIHLESTLSEVQAFNMVRVQTFLDTLRKYPDVYVSIENTSLYDNISGLKKDIVMDVPRVCKYLNKLMGEERFYPLLDICHLVTFIHGSIINKPYSIKDAILAYKSSKFNIHFNYANGIGFGKDHGTTFDSNPILFEQIVTLLDSLKCDVNLIIEVYEDNYLTVSNAKSVIVKTQDIASRYAWVN